MERMNQDIPFEHQMLYILRDYDKKVQENMELRKEVDELAEALEKQGEELKKAKKELKKIPSLKDKANLLDGAIRKREKLEKQVDVLHKSVTYVRNQLRHLLGLVEVPGVRNLEQHLTETLKIFME